MLEKLLLALEKRLSWQSLHAWGESARVSQLQEIQQCAKCCRQRVKANWDEKWTLVDMGEEVDWPFTKSSQAQEF